MPTFVLERLPSSSEPDPRVDPPDTTKERPMEQIFNLAVILIGFLGLGLGALAWGVDTRDGLHPDRPR